MIGEKTLFVRFGGCDYRCAKCDSLHAVIPEAIKAHSRLMEQEDIFKEVAELAATTDTPWVTLSGGNPLMWDLNFLVACLKEAGLKVAVETQGTLWRDWVEEVDHLTISPKGPGMGEKFEPEKFNNFLQNLEDSYNRMMGHLGVSIKVVVFSQMDFEFAVGIDQILEGRNEGVPVVAVNRLKASNWWPRHDRYLSLGNSNPPNLKEDLTLDDVPSSKGGLVLNLLLDYRSLLDDYLVDRRLSHWKFLPQLHVLIYGNKAGY